MMTPADVARWFDCKLSDYLDFAADEDLSIVDRAPKRFRVVAVALHSTAFEYQQQAIDYAYGQCPYFLDSSTGTCSMSCREEPECHTCCPSEGWPSRLPRLWSLIPGLSEFMWARKDLAFRSGEFD